MQTILYVENEEADVFFMRMAFTRAESRHTLRVVNDGQSAIDYVGGLGDFADRAKHPAPNLIFLDLNLPVISGFEVLEWLREQPAFRSLPVIIFSSSLRPDDRKRAESLGATAYVLKPAAGVDFVEVAKMTDDWLSADGAAEQLSPIRPEDSKFPPGPKKTVR